MDDERTIVLIMASWLAFGLIVAVWLIWF